MKKSTNEREVVYEILLRVFKKNEFLNAAIKAVCGETALEQSKKAAVLRMANGSVEKMTELDFIIDTFSNTPVRKQKKEVHVLLLMGVYQLRYMDSVPSHAAINETVKLANAHHFSSLRGFINGVLRSIDRALHDAESPEAKKLTERKKTLGENEKLSIKYAMPLWIVEHFSKEYSDSAKYGENAVERILSGLAAERGTVIRVNETVISTDDYEKKLELYKRVLDKDTDREAFTYKKIRDNAFVISGVNGIDNLPGFVDGEIYVQDLSAIETVEVPFFSEESTLKVSDDTLVVDVCAAPGGKSLYASELIGGKGRIISRDLTQSKVELITDNLRRLKVRNIEAQVWDARVLDEELVGKCDLVIADLPCSGLGVINKKPDIRHRVCADDLDELKELQREILAAVVPYVKDGGMLLYSTCTLDPKENEDNANWILSQWPKLRLIEERTIIPDELHDGFYYACYRC